MKPSTANVITKAKTLLDSGDFSAARESVKILKPTDQGYMAACQITAHTYLVENNNPKFLEASKVLVQAFPGVGKNHHLLGVAYAQHYDWDNAEAAFRQALSLNPRDIQSAENLGVALDANGWHRQSYAQLQQVMQRTGKLGRPGLLALIRNAFLLGDRRTGHDTIRFAQRVASEDPGIMHLDARNAFAHSDNAGGKRLLDQALRKHPRNADILVDQGIYALSSGNSKQAASHLRKALRAEPWHAGAHYVLADMGGGAMQAAKDDREDRLSQMRDGIKALSLPYLKRAELGFAAGKVLDSLTHYDEAFEHYDAASKRIWARLPEDAAKFQASFDSARRIDASAISSKKVANPQAGAGMVFLVGMPRSGTTLLEQILSGLPGVIAGGESGEINAIAQQVLTPGGSDNSLVDVSEDEIAKLSQKNVDAFSKLAPEGTSRTNKEMQLFLRLGMIAILFPAAKVIHVRRNPIDTCVSAYFQFFKLYHQSYTFNLEVLGRYYRAYHDIMKYWDEHLPDRVLHVDYEDLTQDPKSTIQRITTHCNLEWSDACLDFARADHFVTTASIWQVRQGLNQNSVARWRRYEKHLEPLLDGLGDLPGL